MLPTQNAQATQNAQDLPRFIRELEERRQKSVREIIHLYIEDVTSVVAAMEENGLNLQYLPYCRDLRVIAAAVKQNVQALQYIDSRLWRLSSPHHGINDLSQRNLWLWLLDSQPKEAAQAISQEVRDMYADIDKKVRSILSQL